MKRLAILPLLLLGACGDARVTGAIQAGSAVLEEQTEKGIDNLLQANRAMSNVAKSYMCRAPRLEVWLEMYPTPEKQAAFNEICRRPDAAISTGM